MSELVSQVREYKTYTPAAPKNDESLTRVVFMNLLGLEDTPATAMRHDEVLGAPDDMPWTIVVEDIARCFEQGVVGIPAQRASHG